MEECIACAVEALGQVKILLAEALRRRGADGWRKVRDAVDECKHAESHLVALYPKYAEKVRAWRKRWANCMWTTQPPAECLPKGVLEELEVLRDEIMQLTPLPALFQAMSQELPIHGDEEEVGKLKEAMQLLAQTEEGRRIMSRAKGKVRQVVSTYMTAGGKEAGGTTVCPVNPPNPCDIHVKSHLVRRLTPRELASLLAHELAHAGGASENEAKASSRRVMQELKGLNISTAKAYNSGGREMATWTDVGLAYGSGLLVKGATRGLKELDKYVGVEGKPPHERVSTWVNIGLGVALPVLAIYGRVRSPWDFVAVVAGSHFITPVIDYLEEYMAPAPAARVVYRPAVTAKATAPTATVATTPKPAGRYAVTG